MHFSCESCRATLHIADDKVKGKRLVVRCKRCGAKINIADPALAAPGSAARPATAASAPPRAAAAAAPSAPPAARADAGRKGDSDTESTRAMETSVLEEALRASKAAGDDAALQGMKPVQAAPPPPPRDPAIWFAMVGGKQVGPVSLAELGLKTAQGAVGPRTYVWKDGMPAWQRAKDVGELSRLFNEPAQKPMPPPPVPSQPAMAPASRATAPAAAAGAGQFRGQAYGEIELGGGAEPAAAAAASAAPSRPAAAAAKPAPAASTAPRPQPKPAGASSGMDISIEGYQPLKIDDVAAAPTVGEELPLGERVHQERVAKELFNTGHSGSGASAVDLARWASEELGPKGPRKGKRAREERAEAAGAAAAAATASAAPEAAPTNGATRASEEPAAAEPPSRAESTAEILVASGVLQSKRSPALYVAVAIAAVIGIVLLVLFGLDRTQDTPAPTKAEVAGPAKKGLGGSGDTSVTGLMKNEKTTGAETAGKASPAAKTAATPEPGSAPADSSGAPGARSATEGDRGPGSQAPQEGAGDPPVAAVAGLSRDVFERVVRENQPAFRPCNDEALRRNRNMKGLKVLITARIDPGGKVVDAAIDRKDVENSALGQCLLRTTRRIVFPPFTGEQTAGVIPLILGAAE